MTKEAMKLALEWIEAQPEPRMIGALNAITALREALAEQPAQQDIQRLTALVRAQQITIDKLEAQRKPLTYEEITAISKQVAEGGPNDSIDRFVRAIEAAHGIKP